MLGKLSLLLKNKLAIAIMGAVLVAGAGSAAAMAATGQLPLVSQGQSSQHQAQDGSHNGDQNDHDEGDQNDHHDAEGAIKSIDVGNSSFVVTMEHGSAVTVVVNAKTVFAGTVHSFSDLKVGMSVEVKGTTQSDGKLVASGVYVEDEHADNDSSSHATSTPGGDSHTGSGDSDTHTATPSTDH